MQSVIPATESVVREEVELAHFCVSNFASSGESVGDLTVSTSRFTEEPAELPAGGFKGSLLIFAAVI
jgi:hypothetical protein